MYYLTFTFILYRFTISSPSSPHPHLCVFLGNFHIMVAAILFLFLINTTLYIIYGLIIIVHSSNDNCYHIIYNLIDYTTQLLLILSLSYIYNTSIINQYSQNNKQHRYHICKDKTQYSRIKPISFCSKFTIFQSKKFHKIFNFFNKKNMINLLFKFQCIILLSFSINYNYPSIAFPLYPL